MSTEWRRLGDIPRGWYFRLNADDPRWRLLNTEATWLWDKDAKVLCRPPDRPAMNTPQRVDAVNAYTHDPGESVVIALRVDGEWRDFSVSVKDADQLQGMLYLLASRTIL